MNKNIKRILASALVMSSFLSISVFNNYSFTTVKAYAAEYDNAEDGELKSFTISKSNGNNIDLIDRYTEEVIELTSSKSYYLNLKSGIEGFAVNAEAEGDGYVTKIFTSASKTAKGYDSGKYMKLESGSNFVYVRVYESEEAYEEAYNNGDVTKCENTYKFSFIKKEAISDEEDDAEYAYLSGISLNHGEIQFVKSKFEYDVTVDEDVDKIQIKVKALSKDDLIEIGDVQLEDQDYKCTVDLKKGNNEIKINVKNDDDDEKTYTLNIYRGKKASTTNSSTTVVSNYTSNKESWVSLGGKWQYNDVNGQAVKNQWHIDKNGVNYYLKDNGDMATGWQNIQSKWYYFDASGAMKTGWNQCDGKWYYMDKSGAMRTGWFNDYNGKWYYLNTDGSMKTGWLMQGSNWYYLNSDGAMETGSKYIDGTLYTFNSSGELK